MPFLRRLIVALILPIVVAGPAAAALNDPLPEAEKSAFFTMFAFKEKDRTIDSKLRTVVQYQSTMKSAKDIDLEVTVDDQNRIAQMSFYVNRAAIEKPGNFAVRSMSNAFLQNALPPADVDAAGKAEEFGAYKGELDSEEKKLSASAVYLENFDADGRKRLLISVGPRE